MTDPLSAGAAIGILGGGQLGRMLAVAASRLGFRCHVYDPGAAPPAGHVAERVTTAPWDDTEALRAFAASVDVVTYEFENVPAAALDAIEGLCPVRPGRRALAVSQDRFEEKSFLAGIGLATAPFAAVETGADLMRALDTIAAPGILKTRRMGYDGKGQARFDKVTEAATALERLHGEPAIVEGLIPFEREISVIGARGLDGSVACFDPGENQHAGGILRTTRVPARITPAQQADAVLLTGRILNALDYVGVIGVELFVTADALLVNEIAPRVHNSGHWTQNACTVDQFEQHVRAIAGWPLGDGTRYADIEMENLIGADVRRVPEIAQERDAALHLYGKAEARPGRKMGHVNRVRGR